MTPSQEYTATALVEKRSYPSLKSLAAGAAIIFLIFAFISGMSTRFYASALFLMYSVIGSMWLSVVGLGLFQTLLMIPLRVVNLIKSANVEEYKRNVEERDKQEEQHFLIRKDVRQGKPVILWYTVSFLIQLVSYVTIGRLFLIDFYNTPLDPDLLYDFVPYPGYPIEGLYFKIPYLTVTETVNFGFGSVMIAWAIILLLQVVIVLLQRLRHSRAKAGDSTPQSRAISRILAFTSGSTIMLMLFSWFLLTHFPTGFSWEIFSGDISIPNRTFNTITAVATFITILWLDISKILRQGTVAASVGIDKQTVERTQRSQIKDSVRTAGFVGAGAFFITNHIPCAFELSIFTFEIISWLSPLTLDRIILASTKRNKEETKETPPTSETPSEETKQPDDEVSNGPPVGQTTNEVTSSDSGERRLSGEILIG